MMITNFSFINPFPRQCEIMECDVDLKHEVIADWTRAQLGEIEHYTSYFDPKFNDSMMSQMPLRRDLHDVINKACRTYAIERNMPREFVDYAEENGPTWWFSQYYNGERHSLHNHPRALVAGTYYPYADEQSCTLNFRHPAGLLLMMAAPWETNERGGKHEDSGFYRHQPKTGQMLLWPSWMEHDIGPQDPVPREKSRIAISFNWGNYMNYQALK
jgi:uncharacterized protein (TIGR02466 family)